MSPDSQKMFRNVPKRFKNVSEVLGDVKKYTLKKIAPGHGHLSMTLPLRGVPRHRNRGDSLKRRFF